MINALMILQKRRDERAEKEAFEYGYTLPIREKTLLALKTRGLVDYLLYQESGICFDTWKLTQNGVLAAQEINHA